jgi:hypothetical protein
MGEYNVGETALLCCFISIMATIVYFMVPARSAVRRSGSVQPSAEPVARSYRPLWADRPTAEPSPDAQLSPAGADALPA